MKKIVSFILIVVLATTGCTDVISMAEGNQLSDKREMIISDVIEEDVVDVQENNTKAERPKKVKETKRPKEDTENKGIEKGDGLKYSIDQATSDNAQLTTIAFSGLAFLTGTKGADGFFPPGKVADFFGFQYMRDVDVSGYGHNTTFLTKIASNMLYILNDQQMDLLKTLAGEQADLYENYGYGRLTLIEAFRAHYEDEQVLNPDGVIQHSEFLYTIDGQLSLRRAEVFGEIVRSFTEEQLEYIGRMAFNDSSTWPEMAEEGVLDKRSMSHLEHVAVMTYASELFSWYAGSVEADIYFCPERHGTYFGGFYMKDYPAMGNPDYFISTSITGDSGKDFLELLTEDQRLLITNIIEEQKDALERIVEIRTEVSEAFRLLMIEATIDEAKIMSLLEEYGTLEGEMSLLYIRRFTEVGNMITDDQMKQMIELRNQTVYPEGAYLYSQPIPMPLELDTSNLLD